MEHSALYPSILSFLEAAGLSKTAKAFKKETEVESAEGAADLLQLFAAHTAAAAAASKGKKDKKEKAKPAVVEEEEEVQEAPKKKAKREKKEEPVEVVEEAPKKKEKKKKVEEPAEEEEAAPPKEDKKRKREQPKAEEEESPRPVASSQSGPESESQANGEEGEEGKKGKKNNVPFKRIDDSLKDKLKDDRLKNNAWGAWAKDSFAEKAAAQLGAVRGKGFRHEKSKCKRASWKGQGNMDLGVNSYQFSDDE